MNMGSQKKIFHPVLSLSKIIVATILISFTALPTSNVSATEKCNSQKDGSFSLEALRTRNMFLSSERNELINSLDTMHEPNFSKNLLSDSKQCGQALLAKSLDNISTKVTKFLKTSFESPVSTKSDTELISELFNLITTMNTWENQSAERIQILKNELLNKTKSLESLNSELGLVKSWRFRSDLEPQKLEEMKDLTTELTEAQNRTTNLDAEILKLQELKKIAEEGGSRISALESVILQEKGEIKNLLSELSNLNTDKDGDGGIEQAAEENLSKLTKRLKEVELEKAKATERLANVQGIKIQLKPKKEALNTEILAITAQTDKMRTEIDATQSIVGELDARFSELIEKEPKLTNKKQLLASEVSDLEDRLDAATGQIAVIQSAISSDYVSKNEANILEIQIFALQRTIEEGNEQIDELADAEAAADGSLKRFLRACKREPACKEALNL